MPNHEIPLSVLGTRQAALVATLLPARPAQVLVSPYVRTMATAAPYLDRV